MSLRNPRGEWFEKEPAPRNLEAEISEAHTVERLERVYMCRCGKVFEGADSHSIGWRMSMHHSAVKEAYEDSRKGNSHYE